MGKTTHQMWMEVRELEDRIAIRAPELNWLVDEVKDDLDVMIGVWLESRAEDRILGHRFDPTRDVTELKHD